MVRPTFSCDPHRSWHSMIEHGIPCFSTGGQKVAPHNISPRIDSIVGHYGNGTGIEFTFFHQGHRAGEYGRTAGPGIGAARHARAGMPFTGGTVVPLCLKTNHRSDPAILIGGSRCFFPGYRYSVRKNMPENHVDRAARCAQARCHMGNDLQQSVQRRIFGNETLEVASIER